MTGPRTVLSFLLYVVAKWSDFRYPHPKFLSALFPRHTFIYITLLSPYKPPRYHGVAEFFFIVIIIIIVITIIIIIIIIIIIVIIIIYFLVIILIRMQLTLKILSSVF